MNFLDLINRFDPKTIAKEKAEIEQSKIDWRAENYDLGISLGYPKCCVEQFCEQSPLVLKKSKRTTSDVDRYNAGFIGDNYSGFIPCSHHANEIISGKIKLQDLVQNRDSKFPPFPEL